MRRRREPRGTPRGAAAGRRAPRIRGTDRSGFILTLTLILVATLLVIGTFVGFAALRNGLLLRSQKLMILDSSDPPQVIGWPVDFDLCEAPGILHQDPDNGLRALVYVRPDRFVTRNRVYYSGAGCTGDPYLAPPAVPPFAPPGLPVGYLNGGLDIDGAPARVVYGVGASTGFDFGTMLPTGPGRLYRGEGMASLMRVLSVWSSLLPDCTLEESFDALNEPEELIVNSSFEDPALLVGTRSVAALGDTTPPGWLFAGGTTVAGHQHPCGPSDVGCVGPVGFSESFGTGQNVPNGSNSAYSLSALGLTDASITQEVALVPGDTCTLTFWVGCAGDLTCGSSPFAFLTTWEVRIVDGSDTEISFDTGMVGAGSPEWEAFSSTFPVTGAAPYTLELADEYSGPLPAAVGVGEVNYDDFSLTCISAIPAADEGLCRNIPIAEMLVPATEVLDGGTNVLERFTPRFRILSPTLEYSPATPENAPLQTPTITTPGSPVAFPDPGAEDAAPLAEDAPGASGLGDPVTQPDAGPEDDPPPP
jgi:hypothetical protein